MPSVSTRVTAYLDWITSEARYARFCIPWTPFLLLEVISFCFNWSSLTLRIYVQKWAVLFWFPFHKIETLFDFFAFGKQFDEMVMMSTFDNSEKNICFQDFSCFFLSFFWSPEIVAFTKRFDEHNKREHNLILFQHKPSLF